MSRTVLALVVLVAVAAAAAAGTEEGSLETSLAGEASTVSADVKAQDKEQVLDKAPAKARPDTTVSVGNVGGLIPPTNVEVHTDINSPHDNKGGHYDGDDDDDDEGHRGGGHDKGGNGDDKGGNRGGNKGNGHNKGGNKGGDKDVDKLEEIFGQAKPMPLSLGRPHGGNRLGGIKKKIKKKLKKASSFLPLLFIPLLIQAKIIPFVMIKLKLLATKALVMGKLALILLAFNFIRNAYLGSDNIDEHYEKEAMLAKEHYGYTGSPEYGAWVNRRKDGWKPSQGQILAYRGQQPQYQ